MKIVRLPCRSSALCVAPSLSSRSVAAGRLDARGRRPRPRSPRATARPSVASAAGARPRLRGAQDVESAARRSRSSARWSRPRDEAADATRSRCATDRPPTRRGAARREPRARRGGPARPGRRSRPRASTGSLATEPVAIAAACTTRAPGHRRRSCACSTPAVPSSSGIARRSSSEVGERQARVVTQALVTRARRGPCIPRGQGRAARIGRLVPSVCGARCPRRDAAVSRTPRSAVARRGSGCRVGSRSDGGVNTPIMSRSVLSPSEIATWFDGTRRRAADHGADRRSGPDYIEEGEAAEVRGDIAFAQSILETGSFYFPDGGQLTPTDNNFAGMDACDSCAHGRAFPDARTGVRAQMQLLRVYADPTLTNASLNPPPVVANLDRHPPEGSSPDLERPDPHLGHRRHLRRSHPGDLRPDPRVAHRPRRRLSRGRTRLPSRP